MKTLVFVVAVLMIAVGSAHAGELPTPLVDAYLQIHSALAADRFDEAAIARQAQTIAKASSALGVDADKVLAGVKKLQAARDIATARRAFGDVSDALVNHASRTKTDLGADVKVAFCPMANRPWLQKEKEIKNPYYGATMLGCGVFNK